MIKQVKVLAVLIPIFVILFFLISGRLVNKVLGLDTVVQTIEGTLSVLVEDDFSHNTSREKYFLQDDNSNLYQLSVSGKLNFSPGSRIRVSTSSYLSTLNPISLDPSAVSLLESPVSSANPVLGSQRLAVILANFNNLSVSTPTLANAKSLMDTKFSPFFAEISFNKSSVTADVYGWVTMNIPATCDLGTYAQKAITAADSQINFNNYKYVLIVFPNNNPACTYGGIAYYPPGVTYSTAEGNKRLLVSALPDNYFSDWIQTNGIHEFGHSLGLRHANGWECGSATLSTSCSSTEYGDQFDVMGGGGYSYQAHYGAFFKEYLQWLTTQNIRLVTASGIYQVDKIESLTSGIQSLKIPIEGTGKYYNIENRTATGTDATLPANAITGALIKIIPRSLSGSSTAEETNILDSSPGSDSFNDFKDAGFNLNSTFTDSDLGLSITSLSKTNGVLSVKVSFYAPQQLIPANGEKSMVPVFQWNQLPKSSSYTLQVSSLSNFSTQLINIAQSKTSYTAYSLPANTTLYWRVRANYSFGSSDWSPVRTLSVTSPSFSDVPRSHPYYSSIEKLYAANYTAGCSTNPLKFCPDSVMNRAESAVFIIRGNFGSVYTPPAPTHIFSDDWTVIPWAESWAEALYLNGLSSGCSPNPLKFCPTDKLTRAQLAVFGLHLKYGKDYQPPNGTGTVFSDMKNLTYWGLSWAEKAYQDGLLAACSTVNGKPNFCPETLVTRGLSADVIVKAKNL
jgi:M6 family metalloprotease-like protein